MCSSSTTVVDRDIRNNDAEEQDEMSGGAKNRDAKSRHDSIRDEARS